MRVCPLDPVHALEAVPLVVALEVEVHRPRVRGVVARLAVELGSRIA